MLVAILSGTFKYIYLSASEEKNNTETLTDMIVEKIKQCIEQLESEKIRLMNLMV